jgi:hypothetical protein
MKHTKSLLAAALLTPGLLALSYPADEVVFGPAKGTSVTKQFTNTTDLVMDSMSMVMNGEDMSGMAPEMDMSTTIKMVVTDTYEELEEGRPAVLHRFFDTLSTEGDVSTEMVGMGAMEQELSGTSELEGTNVVFSWDTDSEEFDVAFAEGEESDEDLLEGLDEDMDLRLLLPSGAVSEGDSWRVDNERLASMLAPGGDLKIIPDMPEDMGGMGMNMNPGQGGMDMASMLGEVDGSVMATYQGSREVDGARVGSIKITIAISASNDITDMLQAATEEAEVPENFGDMDISYDYADVEFELEGEGELLWNLDAGHLHQFELEGDVAMAMDMGMAMSMMGQDMEMEMSMEMSGTIALGAETRSEG